MHSKNILIKGYSETILDIFTSVGITPDLPTIEGNDFNNLLIATTLWQPLFSRKARKVEKLISLRPLRTLRDLFFYPMKLKGVQNVLIYPALSIEG